MSVIGDVEFGYKIRGGAEARGVGKTRVSLKLLHLHKRFKDCGVNMGKLIAEATPANTPGRCYNCLRFLAYIETRVL